MLNKFLIICGLTFICYSAHAQVTISNGDHTLEIGGMFSTYMNFRSIKEGESNQSKNKDRFRLRNAQLWAKGTVKDQIEYQLQVDFANIGNQTGADADPESPAIMDAYVMYTGLHFMQIKVGYSKLPYSRSSQVPFIYSPYWQRPEMFRGDVFTRRDVGVTLYSSPVKYINLSAGAYTGLGELSLNGDNDPSGKFEFVGRAEFQYPSRYRDRDIDTKVSPIPMFFIGANARYANKALPAGTAFPANAKGEYGLRVVDGKRLGYGMDASFQYMGFSTQFEIQKFKSTPQNANDPILLGLPNSETGGYMYTGGYYVQANYFVKPANLIVSGRFEQFDLNDLVAGNSQRLGGALAYQFNGFRSMVKLQYFNILHDESIATNRWKEQVRFGWQYMF